MTASVFTALVIFRIYRLLYRGKQKNLKILTDIKNSTKNRDNK